MIISLAAVVLFMFVTFKGTVLLFISGGKTRIQFHIKHGMILITIL